jgi:hypothetical protein
MAAKLYPVAKEQLIAEGIDRQRVEAMPVGQVIAIQTARAVAYAYDEIFKVAMLSYADAGRMSDTEQRVLNRESVLAGRAGIPLAQLLLPAVGSVMHAQSRLDRNIAVLKAIEALRMHAPSTTASSPRSCPT